MDAFRQSGEHLDPLRVLIVEDNPDGRDMLQLLLELLGHQVQIAADGVQGVEKALRWHPEVAVIDIGLPRMDGYQVARKIREALGCDIFLISQTGYGRPEDRARALAAGFDVHLVKPVDPADLLGWLSRARRRLHYEDEGPGTGRNGTHAASCNGHAALQRSPSPA
jgi:CheY-like chemotaxis protein